MATPTPEELMALPPEYLAEDTSAKLLHTSIAFIIVPTIFFILFCVSRAIHDARDPWDIWVLVPFSWICVIGLCVIGILIVEQGGGGRHIAYLLLNDPNAIRTYLQLQTATEFLYVLAVTIPKLSLLTLYLRIFTKRLVRTITWITMVAVVLQWLAVGVIVWVSICQPMRFKWNKNIEGHCGDLVAAYRYFSIPNIVLDLIILLLPIHTVWRLQVSHWRKVGIALTFIIGGLGIVAAIIRFRGFFGIDIMADPTFYGSETMLLSIVEPGAYFMCTSIPYIRPLAMKLYRVSGLATTISRSKASSRGYTKDSSKSAKLGHSHSDHESKDRGMGYSAGVSTSPHSKYSEDRDGLIELEHTFELSETRIDSRV